jgi:hypothetical protein
LKVGLIMQSYNVTIAKFLKDFNAGKNILKMVGRIWFSIDCVVQASSSRFDPHLESLIGSIFLYSGLIIVFLVNYLRNRKNLATTKWKEKLYICVFLLQPFYLEFLAGNMSCLMIEDSYRLKSQPETLCYTESYYLWMGFFYIPTLFVWGILFTYKLINSVKKHLSKVKHFENAFSMQYQNSSPMTKLRSKLDSFQSADMNSQTDQEVTPEILGEDSMFLWIGYRAKVNIYVWEIMNWGIKCSIILINQVQMNLQTKYLIMLYIVSHYIIYQTIFNPYRKKVHNWLEKSAKYSLIFVSQTLLFLTFDLDKRLYDFSMAFSVFVAFFFTLLSLILALKKFMLKFDWVKRKNFTIFK